MANITKEERERRAQEAAKAAREKLDPKEFESLEVEITKQDGGPEDSFPRPNETMEAVVSSAVLSDGTVLGERLKDSPICHIIPDKMAGDKDPRVVTWWFDNHPEIAKDKYKDRKVTRE